MRPLSIITADPCGSDPVTGAAWEAPTLEISKPKLAEAKPKLYKALAKLDKALPKLNKALPKLSLSLCFEPEASLGTL